MILEEFIEKLKQTDGDKIVLIEDSEYGNFEATEIEEREFDTLINNTIE